MEGLRPLPWEGVTAVVFVDAGEVRMKNAVAAQQSRVVASSVGIGLRWSVARRLQLAIDAARVLDGTAVSTPGDSRVHASVVLRF